MTSSSMGPRDEILSMIARVRRRWMFQRRLRAAGAAMAACALPLVLALVILHIATPAALPLIALMGAAFLAALVAAIVPMVRAWQTPGNRQVARFIEERIAATAGDRSLNDGLVSAVEVADAAESVCSGFGRLILERASRHLHALEPAVIVPPESMRTAAWSAIAGGACLLLAAAASAPAMGRAADAVRVRFFPDTVRVDVFPGHARVPAGAPLRVRTTVRGAQGALMQVTPVLTLTSAGERQTVAMTPSGEAFEYSIPAVDRTFSYEVTAGLARSADYVVTVLYPPRVTRIDLSYAYPAVAGLAPREEQDGGDIYAPAGTRVRLRIHADKPITDGEIAFAGALPIATRPAGNGIVEADITLAKDDSYRVRLADGDGLQSRGDNEYFIRVMNDRPPDVRILRPSADQQITPLEEIAIEARAEDDHGIAAFDLVYAVGGGPGRRVGFKRVTGTPVERTGRTLLSAEELGVKPGDVISYYARARDVGRGKRPSEATSDIFFLEVKPFSEEFVSAQSQAAAQAQSGDAQLDGLVEAQKQIITATWNIERRSAAGRSSDDVRAVAEAQSSLKARVERISPGGGRRPGTALAPQRAAQAPQPRVSLDPIATAVAAMGKASEQLETERTREALPHEMAALHGLLQAQAEIRRREVSEQRANGSGSNGNRAGQDLSALFDKELQRQQQTNYETEPAIENRPEASQSNDSVLDRIRSLARRQEELSRRQADLAKAHITADELRRQLEKLTREQTELQEQVQDLARRLRNSRSTQQDQEGSRSASSRGRSAPGDNAGAQSLDEAMDRMRAAGNALRHDDAGGAARESARAAEQLRRVDERTIGGGPGAKARAAADLGLEAQQIAEEQHRIAAELARLEAAGGGAADARKRLAAEKHRLADRVAELQRAAARAGAGATESELDAIAQRMRESTKPMSARGEQDLARDLDRAARGLESGSRGERELSAQLERTRAVRDRLHRLEEEMREETRTAASRGRSGAPASGSPGGSAGAGERGEAQQLHEKYRRELAAARQALDELGGSQPTGGSRGGTPEHQQFSRSAPGTEAFKQDRSGWESLRKDLDRTLEEYEAALSIRLARKAADDRFSAGGSERVPEEYQQLIARYFESIATVKKAK